MNKIQFCGEQFYRQPGGNLRATRKKLPSNPEETSGRPGTVASFFRVASKIHPEPKQIPPGLLEEPNSDKEESEREKKQP